jgi:hypothetical protein
METLSWSWRMVRGRHLKRYSVMAITLCYNFVLSQNAFILSTIITLLVVITLSIYVESKYNMILFLLLTKEMSPKII